MLKVETLPAGFEIREEPDELRIGYRSKGTGCLIVFILVVIVPLTTTFGLIAWFDWQQFKATFLSEWLSCVAGACGLLGLLYWTYFVLWLSLGRTEFVATRQNLFLRKQLLGFERLKQIPSQEIEYFEQVKDGGEGEDSFPSWGLRVRARQQIPLLMRQPIEKSDWLGPLLARFYNVEFRACAKRE